MDNLATTDIYKEKPFGYKLNSGTMQDIQLSYT